MADAVSVITAIAGAASVVGTVKSIQAQEDAADAQKKQQRLAVRRERRQAIRQAQFARAQAIATSTASGAFDSSSVKGGVGAVGSQLGEQLGYSTSQSALSGKISDSMAQANTWGGVASIGSSVFTSLGGFSNFQNQQTNKPPQLYNQAQYNQLMGG